MLADILAIVGALVAVVGIALLSIPGALIVAGVLLMVTAWRLS